MPEANANAVQKQLQKAIDTQERVKQAARDAARDKGQPPQPPQAPQGGAK